MLNGLIHAHSGLRWLLLVALIFAIFNAFSKKKNGTFEAKDKMISLLAFILSHIQLLIGLGLYVMEKRWTGFSHMKVAPLRFYAVEHTLGMLIAIVLITIGYSKSKKATEDSQKFGKIAIYYLIALVLILISIPWPFRTALGGHWF
ncbi:MAG: hypothetical protein N4A35_11235 [Flavobacteriales bacterium]|jgi:cellobiose-specific phosphotransferase system component IIC|nr:hypothetical protein [Flavobacteriales bacterium]